MQYVNYMTREEFLEFLGRKAPKAKEKYHRKKTVVDEIVFDSIKEAARYCELSLLQKSGKISDLKLQEKFVLIPAQKIDGKVVERACTYIADFVYTENGKLVVEDCKGMKTESYKIKKKLMLYVHGIQIKET